MVSKQQQIVVTTNFLTCIQTASNFLRGCFSFSNKKNVFSASHEYTFTIANFCLGVSQINGSQFMSCFRKHKSRPCSEAGHIRLQVARNQWEIANPCRLSGSSEGFTAIMECIFAEKATSFLNHEISFNGLPRCTAKSNKRTCAPRLNMLCFGNRCCAPSKLF